MSTQPSLNPSSGGRTLSEGAINRNNQSDGAVTATQPQPPEWCSAHLERTKEYLPVHALGLCYSCFQGKPILKGEAYGGSEFRKSTPRSYFPPIVSLPLFKTDDILDAVAKVFGVTLADLQTHCNAPYYCKPRAMAMYIMRAALGLSLPTIARKLCGLHHTTVMYHLKQVKQQMQDNEEYRATVNNLVAHFSQTREDLA